MTRSLDQLIADAEQQVAAPPRPAGQLGPCSRNPEIQPALPSPALGAYGRGSSDPTLCAAMSLQVEVVARGMSAGRHEAILGQLVRLIALGRDGHYGLQAAVQALRARFVEAAAPDRPGGQEEAQEEFDRSLQGARRIVQQPANRYRACEHWFDDYEHILARTHGFSRGLGGVAQRLVLNELLVVARQRRSRLARLDQGSLAVRTNKTQPKVSLILRRLNELRFLRVVEAPGPNRATLYELLIPNGLLPVSVNTPDPTPTAGLSTDTGSGASWAHPAFQAAGLGPGVGETYRFLPLLETTRPGARDQDASNRDEQRGLTALEVAKGQGKHSVTVRKHLRTLAASGAAIELATGWFGLCADLDELATALGVVDGRVARRDQQAVRRVRYYSEQALWEDEAERCAYRLVPAGGAVLIVRVATGEVVATVTEAWMLRQLEADRLEREATAEPARAQTTSVRRPPVIGRRRPPGAGNGWLQLLHQAGAPVGTLHPGDQVPPSSAPTARPLLIDGAIGPSAVTARS